MRNQAKTFLICTINLSRLLLIVHRSEIRANLYEVGSANDYGGTLEGVIGQESPPNLDQPESLSRPSMIFPHHYTHHTFLFHHRPTRTNGKFTSKYSLHIYIY